MHLFVFYNSPYYCYELGRKFQFHCLGLDEELQCPSSYVSLVGLYISNFEATSKLSNLKSCENFLYLPKSAYKKNDVSQR